MQDKKTIIEGLIDAFIFPFKPGIALYSIIFAIIIAIPITMSISAFNEQINSPQYQQQQNQKIEFEGVEYTQAEFITHINKLSSNNEATPEQLLAAMSAIGNFNEASGFGLKKPPFSFPALILFIILGGIILTKMLDLTAQIAESDYSNPNFKPANYISPFLAFKLYTVYISLGFIIAVLMVISSILSAILSVLIMGVTLIIMMLSVPAIILTLIRTNSILDTINPKNWVETINYSVGWKNYFILLGLTVIVVIISTIIQQVFIGALFSGVLLFLFLSITIYISVHTNFSIYYLMGFMTQHETAEGLEATFNHYERAATNKPPINTDLDDAQRVFNEGYPDDAIALLNNALALENISFPNKLPMYQLLSKVYSSQGNATQAKKTDRLLTDAILNKETNLIPRILPELLTQFEQGEFIPQAKQVNLLASVAYEQRNYNMVIKIVGDFAKKFPTHPDLAANYFLVAKILLEQKKQPEKAYKLLGNLLKKFPNHPLEAEMKIYFSAATRAVKKLQSDS